jgi:serine protease inhibitor
MNRFLSFFLMTIALFACQKDAPFTHLPIVTAPQHKNLVDASNSFGIDLFKTVCEQENINDNIVLSPLSVSFALGMLLNGANGETLDAILSTLRLSPDALPQNNQSCKDLLTYLPLADNTTSALIANSIWYRNDFDVLQSFIDTNMHYFDAMVQALDFNNPMAKDIINDWVANATNDKIDEIVSEISGDHVMFLINAVYFDAVWKYPFDKDETRNFPFYLNGGGQVMVDMMYRHDIPFGHFASSEVTVANLPYGNELYNYTMLLPPTGQSVDDFVSNLSVAKWNAWMSDLQQDHHLHLYMPKFELDYKIELSDALAAMGMSVAMSAGLADFTKINPVGNLYVGAVNHKTFIKLDEEGTEAAAATSVEILLSSMPPSVLVDRPFVFVIHEKQSGAILFIGKIMNPKGA